MKQLNSKKTRFPRFGKILVTEPIAEVYGESKERQLCARRLLSNMTHHLPLVRGDDYALISSAQWRKNGNYHLHFGLF